jgi:hypothetical protein
MRDIETIDSEPRLLLGIRRIPREEEGRPPSTARIDELLDERSALLPPTPGESPRVQIVDRAAPALIGGGPIFRSSRSPEGTRTDR